MTHNIQTGLDNVLLYREKAWHGLGIIIDDDLTARQGLTRAGLDWGVEQYECFSRAPDGTEMPIDTKVNYRRLADGSLLKLGEVTGGYQVIQNYQLADFADALAKEGDTVKLESCGSVKGGRKVWFLIRGDSFSIRGDESVKYIAVSNVHDGSQCMRVTPTSIRIVCDNTLSMVLESTAGYVDQHYPVRHSGSIDEKLEQVRRSLAIYEHASQATIKAAETLADREVNRAKLSTMFTDIYCNEFGEIKINPSTRKEQNALDRYISAKAHFSKRFDDEQFKSGANTWTAFNAFSGLIQHDLKARGQNDQDRVESRVHSNLFGLNQKRTIRAFRHALTIAS